MARRCFARAMPMLLLASLAGCQSKSTEPTILQSRAQPYVIDVPVPAEFELDSRRSTHDQSPGKRQVRHFYMGDDEPLAVKNFYRQKMQEAGWELLDEQLKNGVFFLNYRSPEEKCEVRIEEVPDGMGSQTQVCVEIQRRY